MWRRPVVHLSVGRTGGRDFFTQVAVTFFAQIASLGLSLVTGVLTARFLGPEGKGLVALALLVPSVLAVLASAGLGPAAAYLVGSRRAPLATVSGSGAALALLAGATALASGAALVWTGVLDVLVPGVPAWLVLLAIATVPLTVIGEFQGAILQGLGRIATANLVRVAQGIWVLLATVLLVALVRAGPAGAVSAVVAGACVYLLATSALVRREGGRITPTWNVPAFRAMLSFGLRGHVGTVLQLLNYRFDVFIVNYFLGPVHVGLYTVAVALAELLWFLPNAAGFVIFPKASASPSEKMNSFTPRVLKAVLALSAMSAALLAITGRMLIATLYAPAFLAAYEPMLLLLPGVVLLGGAKVVTNELAGRGYPHYNSMMAAAALTITLLGDVLLIPLYGLYGAAATSSIAYGSIFVASLIFRRVVVARTALGVIDRERIQEDGAPRDLHASRRRPTRSSDLRDASERP